MGCYSIIAFELSFWVVSSPPPSPSACHLASKPFFVRRCLGANQLAPAPLQRF
jgi:hypothetical protein